MQHYTETEFQLPFIILHSAHVLTYVSCPASVDIDFATLDLRQEPKASGIQILWKPFKAGSSRLHITSSSRTRELSRPEKPPGKTTPN